MNAVSFLPQPVIQMTKKKALICYGGKKKGGERKGMLLRGDNFDNE